MTTEVVEQAPTPTDQHQQPAAAGVVFGVRGEMGRQFVDPVGEHSHLHFRRTGIRFGTTILLNDLRAGKSIRRPTASRRSGIVLPRLNLMKLKFLRHNSNKVARIFNVKRQSGCKRGGRPVQDLPVGAAAGRTMARNRSKPRPSSCGGESAIFPDSVVPGWGQPSSLVVHKWIFFPEQWRRHTTGGDCRCGKKGGRELSGRIPRRLSAYDDRFLTPRCRDLRRLGRFVPDRDTRTLRERRNPETWQTGLTPPMIAA
jgi:hypothetical protein